MSGSAMNSHNNYATLQEFIDLTPDAMVLVDAAGKIVLVNRYVETLFGHSPTDLLGQSIETLMPPRFRAAHTGHYHKSFTSAHLRPMGTGLEVFGLCKNGREIPIDVSFNRVNLADQPLVVCVIRDLSQKKQADENLKHALHRYRTLFEDAPAMYVFLGDENGVPIIVNCNEKFVTTLGYPKIDMLGRPLTDFYSPASAIELERNYPRTKNGELVTGERELVTCSGAIIQTLMRAVPEFDPNRQLLSLRVMFIDITERKQAEENLQHYVHRGATLHQIDRAMLSHDPLPQIAAIALRQLQQLVACHSTWVMLFDAPVHTGTILASVGIDDPQFAPNQAIRLNESLVQPCLPHKYQLIEDLTQVECTPDGQRLLAHGIVSLIVIPLKIQGNAVGVLGMGALSKEVFTPTNLEFAYEVTSQLAVAVHNRHLLEQNQLHTEMLERRVLERTAALSEANQQLQLQITKREQTQQALRLQEKRLRSLYEITAITDAPIDDKLNAVLVIGVTLLEMQVGVISRIIDDQWRITHVYSLNDQLAVGQTFALDTTLFDLAIAQKTVISIDNVAPPPYHNHPYFSHCNHQSSIGVQLCVGEACYGALSFASASPRPEPFSPADEDFVRLMGQWIGNRLEQEEAEAALAEEKNLLRTLVDNLPDYIFVKDKEHRYVINNLAHLRLLGLSAQEETAGKTDFDFFSAESVARIHALESAILETGQPIMNQEEQAGDARWWRTTKVPLYTNQGKFPGWWGLTMTLPPKNWPLYNPFNRLKFWPKLIQN
jgi:PAS domain S-box-containing protein